MKKLLSHNKFSLLLFLCFLFNSYFYFSQNPNVITLSSSDNGNKIYVAQDEINLIPNYEYSDNSSKLHAYIQKHTEYQDIITPAIFDNLILNTALEVGSISGSANVSSTGAATYSIEIPTPYGTNNFKPSLGLIYNSQVGNGHLGQGWNLSGISAISAVPKTFQQDGINKAVNPQGNNVLALDGNRLHSVSGNYGANGTVYKTESESYVRITSNGSGSSPDWFKIETKDGLIIEFGNSSDSKIINIATGTVLSWRISKVTDLFGNKIVYVYSNESNDSKIQKIKYSGNDGQGIPTTNSIEFKYATRDDKNVSYYGGCPINLEYLLSTITIYSDNQLFRKFDFAYGMNNTTFLKSITESGAGGIAYNPTFFKYGASNELLLETTSNINSNNIVAQGDYNGDGITDVVTTHMIGSTQFWRIYTNNGDGTFSQYRSGELPQGTYSFWDSNVQDIKTPGTVSSFDFFGDGSDDLILYSLNGSSNDFTINQLLIVDIYEPSPSRPSGYETVHVTNLVTPGGYVHADKFLHIGDFDGDGKDDLFIMKYSSSSDLLYWGKLIRSSRNAWQGASKVLGAGDYNMSVESVILNSGLQYLGSSTNYKVYPTSFDGSGKRQLMVKYDYTTEIFTLKKDPSTSFFTDEKIYYGSVSYASMNQGDFNGDGMIDVLIGDNPSAIGLSTGTEYNLLSFNLNYPHSFGNETRSFLRVADLNGDGKSDILHIYTIYEWDYDSWLGYFETAIETRIDTYISNGISFVNTSTLLDYILYDCSAKIGDFNGDLKFEALLYTKLYQFNPNGEDLLLDKIKNGLGQEVDFDYQYMSNNVNYTKTNVEERFPLNTFQISIPLVEKVSSSDGIDGIATTSYDFEGAKLHRQGKGFLGFAKTTATNEVTGVYVTTENELYPEIVPTFPHLAFMNIPYLMLSKKQEVGLVGESLLISETISTNSVIPEGVKYKVQLDQSVVSNFINTSSTTSSMTYDSYGNIIQSNIDNGIETTTQTNVIGTFGSWWIPSVVTQVTINNLRTGEASYQRHKNYTYTTKGKINTEITDAGTSKAVTLGYVYDNFGNVKQITKMASGHPTVINKTVYDSKGRYIVKSINSLNQEHVYESNTCWGTLSSETDISAKTMTYAYNGMGRLLSSTDPLGNITSLETEWDFMTGGSSVTQPNNTVFKSVTTTSNGPTQSVWYDILGREVKVETEALSGNSMTVKKYFADGTVASTTSPYFNGDVPIVMNYTYDEYQRPVFSTNGVSSTSINYSSTSGASTQTTTTPFGVSSKTTDAAGRVISSTDEGGTLDFTYYSSGNQKNVSLGTHVLVAMEYDAYGRQTKLIDNSAGETHYEYNAYGQLIKQTDANNNQYETAYDIMGRETTKTGPDGVTTSVYVSSGNGLNQLKKITVPNGVFTELFYDNYNRVITETKNIDGVAYNSQYEYDGIGRQSTFTYPSGFKIRYYYDAKSNLISIRNDAGSITYFSNAVENSYGQLTQYIMGNGKVTNNSYTNLGVLSSTLTQGVQDLLTTFDSQTGNLLSRTDNIKSRVEVFMYDDNNRLMEAKVHVPGNPTVIGMTVIDYEANGNISEKSDAGVYTYDATKINAVTKVTNDLDLIPTVQQEINYTPFDRTESISEGTYTIDFTYGPEYDRVKTVLKNSGATEKTKYYIGLYEKEVTPLGIKEIHYIPTPGSQGVYVTDNGVSNYFYVYTDHLGSPNAITDVNGTVVAEQNFDAWGRRRNVTDWTYNSVAQLASQFSWIRGFTGHEHLDEFGLINMNNRMYDPLLARMLAVDNFVQNPFSTQSYNRYSYVWNNPLAYIDPSGEMVLAPVIIGVGVGLYTGYKIAEGKGYDFSNWQTYGYMIGGGIIGGVSGGVSGAIAGAGGVFASTSAIVMGSSFSSIGNYLLSGGSTDVNISFGAASVGSNGFNYLGKKGNSRGQNIGYAFGALANLSDILMGFKTTEADLVTEHTDAVGHSALVKEGTTTHGTNNDPNTIISVGPNRQDPASWHWKEGTNDWATYGNSPKDELWRSTIRLNSNRLNNYKTYVNNRVANGKLIYSVEFSSCVSHTSRALNLSGVFNIGIHPYSLAFQMYLRNIGMRPALFSYLLK